VDPRFPGIAGQIAPQWNIQSWINAEGKPTTVTLDDYHGKAVHLFCFQSWCPGCHSSGFPTLLEVMRQIRADEPIAFVIVQTVFEGFEQNTQDKVRQTQLRYGLTIPMGHDPGDEETGNRSRILTQYRTGGTPWHVFIDPKGTVLFNDFHVDPEHAVSILRKAVDER
jgi:hypothetical protein